MSFLKPFFYKHSFEDKDLLKKLNKIILSKKDFVFKMPKKNSSVILALSGGLDSVMFWYLLLKKHQLKVYPIHFSHYSFLSNFLSGEVRSLRFFSQLFKKKFPQLFNKPKIQKISYNFLLNKLSDQERKKIFRDPILILKNLYQYKKTDHKAVILHNNFLRTNYFSVFSYEYALFLKVKKNEKVETIFFAMVPEDAETTRESTLAVLRSLNIYFSTIFGDWRWQIIAPIDKESNFYYSKKDLIKLAYKDNIPIEKTWSCHNNFFWHCGFCKGCLRRKLAFKEAGITDKTIYFSDLKIVDISKRSLKKIISFFENFFNRLFIRNKKKEVKKNFFCEKLENYCFILTDNIITDYDKEVGYIIFDKKTGSLVKINQQAYLILNFLKKYQNGISGKKIIDWVFYSFKSQKKGKIKKDLCVFFRQLIKAGFGLNVFEKL
jgi:7-cyano-7-deazaguanine synthase in queuosine biosynthesis